MNAIDIFHPLQLSTSRAFSPHLLSVLQPFYLSLFLSLGPFPRSLLYYFFSAIHRMAWTEMNFHSRTNTTTAALTPPQAVVFIRLVRRVSSRSSNERINRGNSTADAQKIHSGLATKQATNESPLHSGKSAGGLKYTLLRDGWRSWRLSHSRKKHWTATACSVLIVIKWTDVEGVWKRGRSRI